MEEKRYRIEGVAPLILHNGQMADPLNAFTRARKPISGKRNKTDADHEALAKMEWRASLYVDEQGRIIMPGDNLTAMLITASKKRKLGKQFAAGVWVEKPSVIVYDGPTDFDKLYADERFRFSKIVNVQKQKIVRCRPIFPEWSMEIVVNFFSDQVSASEVDDAINISSYAIGMGDWRPRFGRFKVV
jgi:hypothetical protein